MIVNVKTWMWGATHGLKMGSVGTTPNIWPASAVDHAIYVLPRKGQLMKVSASIIDCHFFLRCMASRQVRLALLIAEIISSFLASSGGLRMLLTSCLAFFHELCMFILSYIIMMTCMFHWQKPNFSIYWTILLIPRTTYPWVVERFNNLCPILSTYDSVRLCDPMKSQWFSMWLSGQNCYAHCYQESRLLAALFYHKIVSGHTTWEPSCCKYGHHGSFELARNYKIWWQRRCECDFAGIFPLCIAVWCWMHSR